MNSQLYKLGFKEAEVPDFKLPTLDGLWGKQGSCQENICFIDNTKAFDYVNHNKLWKILKEKEIQGYLTCLLRNLCAEQEATVKIRWRTIDWFKIGKGLHQGCILSSCLFNFYAEHIMGNAGATLQKH